MRGINILYGYLDMDDMDLFFANVGVQREGWRIGREYRIMEAEEARQTFNLLCDLYCDGRRMQ